MICVWKNYKDRKTDIFVNRKLRLLNFYQDTIKRYFYRPCDALIMLQSVMWLSDIKYKTYRKGNRIRIAIIRKLMRSYEYVITKWLWK